jgi:hypothetical protein
MYTVQYKFGIQCPVFSQYQVKGAEIFFLPRIGWNRNRKVRIQLDHVIATLIVLLYHVTYSTVTRS